MKVKLKLRKIISVMLVLIAVFSNSALISYGANAEYGYDFIESLGAFPEGISKDTNLTKGEFIGILSKVLYKDMTGTTNIAPFSDVPKEHKYAGAIALMKGLGVVNGDLYGNFNPDVYITPNQAVTVLVKALGYTQHAEAMGGYPSGYLYIAKLNGITKNIQLSGDYISLSVSAQMIYNALFSYAVVLDRIEDGEPVYKIDSGTTVMTEFLDIEKYTGTLIADSKTCVSGNYTAGEGQVLLKDSLSGKVHTLICDNPSISSLLGVKINAFVYSDKESGEVKIVYFETYKDVVINEILSSDIINTQLTAIEYEVDKESGKTKTVNFSDKGATVLINGVKTAIYTKSDLKPESGKVVLIDNDNDGKPEIINVYKYTGVIITERVSVTDEIIVSRFSSRDNIDFSEDSSEEFYIFKDGQAINFSDIKESDVIIIAKSSKKVNGKYITYLFVSSSVITGNVTAFSENDMTISIDDAEYDVSLLYKKQKPSLFSMLSVNSQIDAYIDSDGFVAYIDGGRTAGTYYYIVNLYSETSFEGEIKLRLFTDLCAFSDPSISDNVVIDGARPDGKLADGSSATRFDEIREMLSIRPDRTIDYLTKEEASAFNKNFTNINPRPAKIKFNAKGEVSNIDTDAPNYQIGDEELEANDDATLKPGRRDFRVGRFNNTLGTVDGTYFITENTVVLKVADVDRYDLPASCKNLFVNPFEQDLYDIANYRVLRKDQQDFVSPGGYIYYDMQGYDIDPADGTAGLVIIRGYSDYTGYQSTPIAVFDRVSEVYDAKTQTAATKIYYYVNGVETGSIVNKDKLHPYVNNVIFGGTMVTAVSGVGEKETPSTTVEVPPLRQGDVIAVVTDADGYVNWLWKDIDIATINNKPSATQRPLLGSMPYRLGTLNGAPILQAPLTGSALDLSGSYSMLLGVAKSSAGYYANVLMPYTVNTNGIEIGAPISNILTDSENVMLKVFNLGNSARYTLVEEIECNSHLGKPCKFRIKDGTINDIKCIDSFAEDGLKKASRLFTYSQYGTSAYVVIMNLDENHGN